MSHEPFSFPFDERLRVNRPVLHTEYESMSRRLQAEFEWKCQRVCAQIPPQIKAFETQYMQCFEALNHVQSEEEFQTLMEQMNDLSSRISDLNILYLHIEGTYIGANVHT